MNSRHLPKLVFGLCILLASNTFRLPHARGQEDGGDSQSAELKSTDSDSSPGTGEDVADDTASNAAPTYWAARVLPMKFGIRVESNDTICTRILATIPFPMQWPEQSVEITGKNLPDNARYQLRELPGGATQLVIVAPSLPANSEFTAVVEATITKSFIKAPEETEALKRPRRITRDLKWYMGDSPMIETKDRAIRNVLDEIFVEEPESDWVKVEMIYDWVRDNIEYRNGELRSTREALKDRFGDCEEMTGLFVALCRASKIPARCVWIPEHCYPEFYLEDGNGDGHWYPCQVAGERQFGEMNEYRPILQKGDRFKVPEKRALQHYIAEFFTCKTRPTGPLAPVATPVRDLGELKNEIAELQQAAEQQLKTDNEG